MKRIGRRKVPSPIFPVGSEWKTAPDSQALDIMRAKTDPVRSLLLELLEFGSMRKFELARYVHRILGKKYSRSLIQYHLRLLERAGLVGSFPEPEAEGKASLVYKSADVRIQLRPREPSPRAPRIPEEMLLSLAKKYGKECQS